LLKSKIIKACWIYWGISVIRYEIRKADLKDAKSILELIRELAVFELQPDAVIITENDIIDSAFGKNPWVYIYVAEVENKVVGMALYYFSFSTWKGRSLHLEDLVVKEDYRKHGIGKALFQIIIEIAKNENVGRMSWEVLEWNEPAIKLYESVGAHFYKDWHLCRLFKEDLKSIA
jgi:GNAT superfamily N-acetyltransferase